MTEPELVAWLESPEAWEEMERCWALCTVDQRARTGRRTDRVQMVELMLARIIEEVRALPDSLAKGILLGHLLQHRKVMDQFLELIPTPTNGRFRASAIIAGRVVEILRAVYLHGPGEQRKRIEEA